MAVVTIIKELMEVSEPKGNSMTIPRLGEVLIRGAPLWSLASHILSNHDNMIRSVDVILAAPPDLVFPSVRSYTFFHPWLQTCLRFCRNIWSQGMDLYKIYTLDGMYLGINVLALRGCFAGQVRSALLIVHGQS